jgi:hypothetical protein
MHSVCDGSNSYIKNLENDSNKDIVLHTQRTAAVRHTVRQKHEEQKNVKKFLSEVYSATKEITAA